MLASLEAYDVYNRQGCRLFVPYEQQNIFFQLGKRYQTRTLSGANRVGKTTAFYRGELPFHLTGEYPDWWEGYRFTQPITAMVGSTDWKTNIKGCQMALVGDVLRNRVGMAEVDHITGEILPCGLPQDRIASVDKLHQVKGALSGVEVRHVTGGTSYVYFIAYSQGSGNLQAAKIDIVAMDEEPPMDIYVELVTRTMDSQGMRVLTFTPLSGLTDVVQQQIGDLAIDEHFPSVVKNDVGALVRISMHDAPHLTPKMIEDYKKQIPEYTHMARVEGIPALGEGLIFTVNNEKLKFDWPYGHHGDKVPMHWWVIDGMDIGIDHPTARARVYYDPDTRTYYLTQCYCASDMTTKEHAANWREEFHGRVPVVWPGDGRNRQEGLDGDTLESVRDKYDRQNVYMTEDPVTMPSGVRLSREGAIHFMDELMKTGKLKVNINCPTTQLFFNEKILYRRERNKNGKVDIVGKFDDVIHAVRNAILALGAIDEGYGHQAVQVGGVFGRYAVKFTKEEAIERGLRLPAPDDDDDGDYRWIPGT